MKADFIIYLGLIKWVICSGSCEANATRYTFSESVGETMIAFSKSSMFGIPAN